MNYGELKTDLKELMNRRDITDELAGKFIRRAISRLERTLRLPFMERLATYPTEGPTVSVPSDFIELINLYTDHGTLQRMDLPSFQRISSASGIPYAYRKERAQLHIRPTPEDGTLLYLHYYGEEPPLASNTDENGWTISAVDAVLYGAAELAADFYEDERNARFAEKYIMSVRELEEQMHRDDASGPSQVSPAYFFDD